jgi:hypothetical protein
MNYKKVTALFMASVLTFALSGCGQSKSSGGGTNTSATSSETAVSNPEDVADLVDTSDMFTDRDTSGEYDSTATDISLSDDGSTCDSADVTISGNTITITKEGTYHLSGTLTDGQVIVDADGDKVQLVLDNVSITNSSSAAIYVKKADKVFLTLADGSANTLATTGEFVAIDDNNIDAAIFSKSDLTLNGTGSLTIDCASGHGVVSKDDLRVTAGTYTITAASHALSGKDSIRIAGGTFTLTAGKDGIHSENTDDTEKGFIYIADGTFTIDSTGDGIDASAVVQIDGGNFDITAGGGTANAASHTGNDDWMTMGRGGGKMDKNFGGNTDTETDSTESTDTQTDASSDNSTSCKGIKADGAMKLSGLTLSADTADDSVHAGGIIYLMDGTYDIATGDDGVHTDSDLILYNGDINITQSYEGLEGLTITIYDGNISVVASDDGLNAAGGNDSSGFGGFGGGMDYSAANQIVLNGGTLYVNASGDGIDSNGDFTMNGGTVTVDGPTNDGDAPLDWGGSGIVNGGTLIAVGSSGMAEGFSTDSTQGVMLVTLSSTQTGDTSLSDADGNTLLTYTAAKSFNSVIFSSSDITEGATYTVTAGSETTTVEMTSLVYGSGSGMGGGGNMGGGFGGGKGGGKFNSDGSDDGTQPSTEMQMPDGTEMPEMPDGAQMPDGTEMPEMPSGGFGDGQMPNGNFGDGQGGGQMPDGTAPSTDGQTSDTQTQEDTTTSGV